jgi:hypothetical protein
VDKKQPNRPKVKSAPRATAPRQARAGALPAAPTATSDGFIPWESPALQSALVQEIARAWAGWAAAVDFAPQIAEAPEVAEVLGALRAALHHADRKALGALQAGARAAREIMAPAIAEEQAVRLGVPVTSLLPKRTRKKSAGRRGDRADALDSLARQLDGYLSRASRRCACRGCKVIRGEPIEGTLDVTCAGQGGWALMPPLTAEEMAKGFLTFVAHAEPITGELKRLGLVAVGPLAQQGDRDTLAKVTRAFERKLDKTARTASSRKWTPRDTGTSRGTSSTGQDLVRVGLRGIGCTAKYVKGLYDRRD